MEVDTMRLAIRVRSASFRGRRKLPSGLIAVTSGRGVLYVEGSLPKAVNGHNVDALPLRDALDALRELLREVEDVAEVDPARDGDRFELLEMRRLDAVRDFHDVEVVSNLLDGLERAPLMRPGRGGKWWDLATGACETLWVGTDDWRGMLYDKAAESGGLAPAGRLRFEALMRADFLRSARARRLGAAIRVVGDITEPAVANLRRWVFEACGFDREVRAVGPVAEAVFRVAHLDPQEQSQLWALLTASPYAAIGMKGGTLRKYRSEAARLGLVPGLYLDRGGVSVRLDYLTGREVVTRWTTDSDVGGPGRLVDTQGARGGDRTG